MSDCWCATGGGCPMHDSRDRFGKSSQDYIDELRNERDAANARAERMGAFVPTTLELEGIDRYLAHFNDESSLHRIGYLRRVAELARFIPGEVPGSADGGG